MAIISRQATTADFANVQAAYAGTGIWADGHDGKPVVSGAAPLQDGDTLVIPTGDVSWGAAQTLTIARAIKVQGQGSQSSITNTANKPLFIIQITPQPAGAGFNTWLGGMILRAGSGAILIKLTGSNWNASHRGFRIHHIRFQHVAPQNGITINNDGSAVIGVIDHCTWLKGVFDDTSGAETTLFHHDIAIGDEGGTSSFGDGSWNHARDPYRAIYFEDNVWAHQFDGQNGFRIVTRHCTADPGSGQGCIPHGLDSGSRGRGTFSSDVYNNILSNPAGANNLIVGTRGGNGRWFNNDATGTYDSGRKLLLYNYRLAGCTKTDFRSITLGTGGADGTTVWDTNDRALHTFGGVTFNPALNSCNGDFNSPKSPVPALPANSSTYPYAQYQGAVYASMTYDGLENDNVNFPGQNRTKVISSGSGLTISFLATQLPNPAVDCWRYFCVRNVTKAAAAFQVAASPQDSWALIEKTTTVTVGGVQRTQVELKSQGNPINAPGLWFTTGDQCEIRKVISSIDLAGNGKGALMSGPSGGETNVSLGTPGPLNQINEHIYHWNNRLRSAVGQAWTALGYPSNVWNLGVGDMNSLAQIKVSSTDDNANVVLKAPPISDDINWVAGVTGTEANYIGADEEVRNTFFPSDVGVNAVYPVRYLRTPDQTFVEGTGGIKYPHYIVRDALPDDAVVLTPAITNTTTSFQFIKGTAAVCNPTPPDPKVNCFTVTHTNFSGTPTLTVVSGALPANVAISGLNISGTAGTATVGDYDFTIRATYAPPTPDETADKAFRITVVASHTAPTNVSVTKPTNNSSFTAPATITLESTATTNGAALATMQYYHGGTNLIATVDATAVPAPYSYDWTGVAAGAYNITVKATDNASSNNNTTSSAVAVSVGSVVTLPAPTIVVTSGQPVTPPPVSTKKILHWQVFSNSGSISSVVTNHVYVDTLPFDGLFMKFTDYQDCLGPTYVANYNTLYGQIGSIKNVLLSLTHNYVTVLVGNSGMVDPFDDWTQTQTNFVTLAQVCRDAGLEGFVFDNEEYNVHMWTYPGDLKYGSTKTALEYKDQWRLRGTEVMQAIIAEWPAAKILVTLGPNRSVTAVPAGALFQGDPNWMGGYFFMGLFAGAPTGNHVISGGELYYNRTVTQFSNWKNFFDTIYTQNATLMPSNLNTTWNANDDLSFGIYDQDAVGSPVMSPSVLQQTIINAMPYADELIWNYSESLDWLTPGAGSAGAWQDAVRAARTALGI